MTSWWIFVGFCFYAAIIASVSTVLALRRRVTHVRLARRPHYLYSRSLFLSRSLSLSYFLLCLGRTVAGYAALENHGGGDCHAMIFAAARLWCHDLRRSASNFLADLVWMLIRVYAFYLRKPGETSTCPVFKLHVPPRVGANRRVCITAFWYLRWLKHLFDTFYFWERWR